MNLPTREEVKGLLGKREGLSVSIFMPTHRAAAVRGEDQRDRGNGSPLGVGGDRATHLA